MSEVLLARLCWQNIGYIAEAPHQTESTVSGIKMSVSIYPCIVFVAGVALLAGYKINKKMELTIEKDLKERRS